ncbi:hypothetical protein ANN_08576 [Periplaneta americana]|uniref:Mos1 transposase HTH domain-containing protein n=1 Tax=Periplaneta americana TaxID=6978 RepID=A0ABQ8T3E0_PERAM|nr:hypothetical protein ANN_08576 [Periplaneta americana]
MGTLPSVKHDNVIHDGLVEAFGETALPNRTVARWVRAFNKGRDRMEIMARPGRPSNRLKMRKIASQWVPWDLTEAQRWIRYDTAQTHLECYDREEDAFLRHIVALDETWARSYEPLLKRQSNEWRHYGHHAKQ